MSQCFLYVDIDERRITLVRLPAPSGDAELEGRIYENVGPLEDAVAQVLDMTHSDASGVLMAGEMQGRDWALEPIDNRWYVTLRRVPELQGLYPRVADFEGGGSPLMDRIRAAIAVKAAERAQ